MILFYNHTGEYLERKFMREKLKKLLSFVLSLTMIFTLVQVNNITAGANEAETYSYSVGTGDDAGKLIATCNGECGNAGSHVYKLKLSAKTDFLSKMSTIYEGLSVTDESGKDISDNTNAWIAAGIAAPVVEYYWMNEWRTQSPTAPGNYTVRMYPASDNTKTVSADFSVLSDKLSFFDFTLKHNDDGSYVITSANNPEGLPIVVGAMTNFGLSPNTPEAMHDYLISDAVYGSCNGQSIEGQSLSGEEWTLKTVSVGENFSFDPEYEREEVGIFVGTYYETWMENFFNHYRLYSVGMTDALQKGESGNNVLIHKHSWNSVVKDNKLYLFCSNTRGDCDYRGTSADLENACSFTLDLTEDEFTYNGNSYDGVKIYDQDENTVNFEDEFIEEMGLKFTFVGRDGTTYEENETAPAKLGKYKVNLYSACDNTQKISADFEIVVPEHPDGYKVVVCSDEDFDYIFYKDGSYTSDVANDANGTFGDELAFFNATGETVYIIPETFDAINDANYVKIDKSDIQMFFKARGIENGVGIECKYVASEKMVYITSLVHEDVWDFSVDGTTLTAVCKCDESTSCYNVCDFKDKTLEERTFVINLSGKEKMDLSGNPYTVSLLDDSKNEIPEEVLNLLGINVRYSGRNNTEYDESTAPYQAGKYTVKLYSKKAPEKIASLDFEITFDNPSGAEKVLQGGKESWTYKFYKDGTYISNAVGDESGKINGDAAIINVLNITMDVYKGNSVFGYLGCTEYKMLNVSDILKKLGKEDALGIECTYIYGEKRSYFFLDPIEHKRPL